MKKDERKPLSLSQLRKQCLADARHLSLFALLPLLVLIPLAYGITYGNFVYCRPVHLLFWLFMVIAVIPLWLGVIYFLYHALVRPLLHRRKLAMDLLRIETDEVNYLTEEPGPRGRSMVCVVYLVKYGRCEIARSLWDMLGTGDSVYAAVIHGKKPEIVGVYSTLTHKIAEE